MNWLAHLLLSEPSPAFRIGNLLPDLVPASALVGLPEEFRRGAEQHRRIDAFTDTHPIVRRSILRVTPPRRRLAGVLVDIFYDHFLTCAWAEYAPMPLPDFLAEFYGSFAQYRAEIPPEAYLRLEQMRAANWLGSYGDLAGITETLRRMESRFRRPVPLAEGGVELELAYEGFREDFRAFFPELRAHVGA